MILYDNANELRTRLTSVEKLFLTTVSWTALTTESYQGHLLLHTQLGNTCVWFCRPKQCQSVILLKIKQICFLPLLSTGDETEKSQHVYLTTLATWCQPPLNAYDLNDSQPCFSHSLQLAINDGFKLQRINHVSASASCLVCQFNPSSTATQALKQQFQNLPDHK